MSDDKPWESEPDRVEWRAHGFPCLLRRNAMGVWCGYVAVPPGHPWHGVSPFDIEAYAHGGLNYGETCTELVCHVPEPGESDDVWWLGFDAAHGGDYAPKTAEALAKAGGSSALYGNHRDYRDLPYMQAQCEQLATQAKEAACVRTR